MIRACFSLLSLLAVADFASAQQFRRGFPAAPIPQPVFRPAVLPIVPVVPVSPVIPVIPPASSAVGQTIDPFTGTVTQFGSAFDPLSGTVQQSAAPFNPLTGTTQTQHTLLDAFTCAAIQRRTAGNPITGQFISSYRSQRPQFLPVVPLVNPLVPRVPLFR